MEKLIMFPLIVIVLLNFTLSTTAITFEEDTTLSKQEGIAFKKVSYRITTFRSISFEKF